MISSARSLIVNSSSVLIAALSYALMFRRSWEFVVAVLSPNKKLFSSVFIYGKASQRSNDEILFLSRSGEQRSVIGLLKNVAL